MSSWLSIIYVIGSSISLEDFPNRFLKCSYYIYIRTSWVAAFNLALAVLFLQLTSFTVCHAILDCLSSTESLILLIWSWMYSVCSLRYALVRFVPSLHLWALALVDFLLLLKDAIFTSSRLFLTANVFQGTLCFDLSLIGMHSAASSMSPLTKFSYLSFEVIFLISSVLHRICFFVISCIYRKYLYC